jgi:hypothetical protein
MDRPWLEAKERAISLTFLEVQLDSPLEEDLFRELLGDETQRFRSHAPKFIY